MCIMWKLNQIAVPSDVLRRWCWLQVTDEQWQTKGNSLRFKHFSCYLFQKLATHLQLLSTSYFSPSHRLWSTSGPQTPFDMWSLPQDVTIETAPLGWRGGCFPERCGGEGYSDGRLALVGRQGWGLDAVSLINLLYGPPGLWRWPERNEWSQSSWLSHHSLFPSRVYYPKKSA